MKAKLFIIATLLTAFPLILFATDYRIATSDLNVRTGPGAGYSISFIIKKGDKVELLSKKNAWYKISYLGKTGYASSRYLVVSSAEPETKVSTKDGLQMEDYLLIIMFIGLAVFSGFVIYRIVRDRKLVQTVTGLHRGTPSERNLVLQLLNYGILQEHVFHDLYIEKGVGKFAQADLVVVTKVGVIVIEVKEYSGLIFGNGRNSHWTQVLAYGRQKYYFYNPILQNSKHVEELRKQISGYGFIPFYSIVVFYGNCNIKNVSPDDPVGTFVVKANRVPEVMDIILRDNLPCIYRDEQDVLRILRRAVTNGADPKNQMQHIENIRDMLGAKRIFD